MEIISGPEFCRKDRGEIKFQEYVSTFSYFNESTRLSDKMNLRYCLLSACLNFGLDKVGSFATQLIEVNLQRIGSELENKVRVR